MDLGPATCNILDVAGLLKLPQLKRHTDDYLTLGAIHKVSNDVSGRLGDWYTDLGAQTLAPKKAFLIFSFSSCISIKKYVEVAISDFTMHLIISKWLRIMQTEEKNNEKKRSKQ